jgi:poly-gamma-glutamate capsule biosynthesis protein CapA/YwtB (metallophosphatase superfamily)
MIAWILFLCASTLLTTCTSGALSESPSTSESSVTHSPRSTEEGVLTTPTLSSGSSTPTITSSPTPRLVILSIHERWLSAAEQAVSESVGTDTDWSWQLETDDDPAEEVASGRAHVGLIPEEGGVSAGQRPFALAVPFNTEWEALSLPEAQELYTSDNPFVARMDWEYMQPTLRSLRVDGHHPSEAGYPLLQLWSLITAPGYEAAAVELSSFLAPRLSTDPTVHIAAVGDIMLDRALGEALGQGDVAYPFAQVMHLLSPMDISVGNLESALGELGSPEKKGYTFRAPPEAALGLSIAGFDLLSLANNHALDYGTEALFEGINLLNQFGIATIGAGVDEIAARQPFLQQINGIQLAFVAYVDVPIEVRGFDAQSWTATATQPGVAWVDLEQIHADIAAAKQLADVVIVLLHSGYENDPEPSPPQEAAAHAAVDAGAQLVIGHHSHVLQGVEFYKDGVIVYGLGNFAFEDGGPPESAVLHVWLDADGVRELEFHPLMLEEDGRPRPATEAERGSILEQISIINPDTQ